MQLLRHDANGQHIQHNTHTPARHHRPNEQIVRYRIPRTELENRVHTIGAGEGACCYAADDWGIVSFDSGGRVEKQELEACPDGVSGVSLEERRGLWGGGA